MKWNFFYSSIAALLLASSQNFAQSIGESSPSPLFNAPGNWFISLGGGAEHPKWHNPMKVSNGSILPRPYDIDLYSTKNQNEGVLALYAGRRWQRDSFWFPAYSLGLFWQYFFRTHLGKTITLYSNPAFTDYKYSWNLTANLLLASAKLNLIQQGMWSPFINVGIGSSYNRTSDYQEKALGGIIPRMSPRFSKFSTSEFAYQLGAGIDLRLSPRVLVSVGYNYQDLGQISSGPGQGMWSTQSLNPGSYHSNELLVSATYLFEK